MKTLMLLGFASSLLSCRSDAISHQSDIGPRSTTLVQRNLIKIDSDLDARLSLISPPSREMLHLMGTNDAHVFGLTLREHKTAKQGRSYIESDKFLAFEGGKRKGNFYAEVVDRNTKIAVGTFMYSSSTDVPIYPTRITELCTGTYESVCTLIFNDETQLFELKVNQFPENVPANE